MKSLNKKIYFEASKDRKTKLNSYVSKAAKIMTGKEFINAFCSDKNPTSGVKKTIFEYLADQLTFTQIVKLSNLIEGKKIFVLSIQKTKSKTVRIVNTKRFFYGEISTANRDFILFDSSLAYMDLEEQVPDNFELNSLVYSRYGNRLDQVSFLEKVLSVTKEEKEKDCFKDEHAYQTVFSRLLFEISAILKGKKDRDVKVASNNTFGEMLVRTFNI